MKAMSKAGAVFCAICFVLFLCAGCNGKKETEAETGATGSVVTPSDDGGIELPMIPA